MWPARVAATPVAKCCTAEFRLLNRPRIAGTAFACIIACAGTNRPLAATMNPAAAATATTSGTAGRFVMTSVIAIDATASARKIGNFPRRSVITPTAFMLTSVTAPETAYSVAMSRFVRPQFSSRYGARNGITTNDPITSANMNA